MLKTISIITALVGFVGVCFAVDGRYTKKTSFDTQNTEIEVLYQKIDGLERKVIDLEKNRMEM